MTESLTLHIENSPDLILYAVGISALGCHLRKPWNNRYRNSFDVVDVHDHNHDNADTLLDIRWLHKRVGNIICVFYQHRIYVLLKHTYLIIVGLKCKGQSCFLRNCGSSGSCMSWDINKSYTTFDAVYQIKSNSKIK